MDELRIETVPCFLHSEIQGEEIPLEPRGLPLPKLLLDKLLEDCPVVVELPDKEDDPTDSGYAQTGDCNYPISGLRRITPNHGRSYELILGNSKNQPEMIWGDEFGSTYTSLSLKGANFSRPHIMRSLTAPSGYIPYGLLESDALLRVLRASRIMRENKIGTENILRVFEPRQIRYNKLDPETGLSLSDEFEYVNQEEFKRRLLHDHWLRIADRPDATEEFQKVKEAIDPMIFFITLRSMGIGSRILDLVTDDSEAFDGEIAKLFKVVSLLMPDATEGKDSEYSTVSPEKIENYLFKILPFYIGMNLGNLHRLGLAHTFPVLGNITLLGDLVDLDSVRGEALGLGDKPVGEEEFRQDLKEAMGLDLERSEGNFFFAFVLRHIGKNVGGSLGLYIDTFNSMLVGAYAFSRFGITLSEESEDIEPSPDKDNVFKIIDNLDTILSTCKNFSVYNVMLQPVIEGLFDTDELPDLYSAERLQEINLGFAEWTSNHLREMFHDKVQETIGNHTLEDLSQFAFSNLFYRVAIDELIYPRCLDYLSQYFNQESARTEISDETIKNWIEEHRLPTNDWSDDDLYKLLINSVSMKNIDQQFNEMTEKKWLNDFDYFNLNLVSVLNTPNVKNSADQGVMKMFINGRLMLFHDQIKKRALLKRVQEDGNSDRGAIKINNEDIFTSGDFPVEVPAGYSLVEVFTDGQLDCLETGNVKKWGEPTAIFVRCSSKPTYSGYVLEENDTGNLTLTISRHRSPSTLKRIEASIGPIQNFMMQALIDNSRPS